MSVELIKKLFTFKKKYTYAGELDVYVRIPGDQVIDDVRTYALLESRKLRKKLRDINSEEYLIHIDIFNDLSDEELITLCVNFMSRDTIRDFVNSTPKPPLPELPDYPTQEQQEEYTITKTERDTNYNEDLRIYVEEWRKRYSASLTKMKRNDVMQLATRTKVDRVCEEEFSEKYEDGIIVASTFTDEACNDPLVTIEQFQNLPREIKVFLRECYRDLSLSGDDLKK